MTDISKIQDPGDEDDSGGAGDIDLDFDLEALISEAPAPGAVPEAPAEPEVVIFSRKKPQGEAPPPIAPVTPVPLPDPVPVPTLKPAPTVLPEPFETPAESGDDIEAIFALPTAALQLPEHENALPPRRDGSGEEEIVIRNRRTTPPGDRPATALPPRRREGLPPSSPDAAAWQPGPAAAVAPMASAEPAPTRSPFGNSLPPKRGVEAPPEVEGDGGVKELWGGGEHPEVRPNLARIPRSKQEGWTGKLKAVKAVPLKWLLIGGAGIIVVVAFIAFLGGGDEEKADNYGRPPAGSPPPEGTKTATAPSPPDATPLDQSSALNAIAAGATAETLLAQYNDIATVSARRFYAATTIEEMLSVVRDPARVEPLMREFYARNPLGPREFAALILTEGDDAMLGTKVFWKARVALGGDERSELIFEQLKSGPRKAFLVDWETAVDYNPMRWDAFATEGPTEPLDMRVFCTVSTEYRTPFNDASKYAAFLLTHSDGKAEVHAYAERDSEVGQYLRQIAEGDFEARVYLKLRFAPDSKDCVEILGLVDAEDWIVVR